MKVPDVCFLNSLSVGATPFWSTGGLLKATTKNHWKTLSIPFRPLIGGEKFIVLSVFDLFFFSFFLRTFLLKGKYSPRCFLTRTYHHWSSHERLLGQPQRIFSLFFLAASLFDRLSDNRSLQGGALFYSPERNGKEIACSRCCQRATGIRTPEARRRRADRVGCCCWARTSALPTRECEYRNLKFHCGLKISCDLSGGEGIPNLCGRRGSWVCCVPKSMAQKPTFSHNDASKLPSHVESLFSTPLSTPIIP